MSLHVHRAERSDRLATALADLLSDPCGDPFATELVAVPTRGVERWLSQQLAAVLGTGSSNDGVCAGVDFPPLDRLIGRAMATASGIDPYSDPWSPSRAAWPLLRVIDESQDEPWAKGLWLYLRQRDGTVGSRRWSLARHLAGLFRDYSTSRPQMVRSWLRGHDVDASAAPLKSDRVWQAEMFRRLRERIGSQSPAERVEFAAARLREDPTLTDLPQRLSVFGPTRLNGEHLAVLGSLAAHRELHLWLTNPSPPLWDEVLRRTAATPTSAIAAGPRSTDPTATAASHPLLSSLGRDGRELQVRLREIGLGSPAVIDQHHASVASAADPGPAPRLLGLLQQQIAANKIPATRDDRPLIDSGDSSIQIHRSHGPDRQVEVLRELLVGLLADDPSLEPRDIIVMCPDIEAFAPLIAASFGLELGGNEDPHPGHRLRVRLADRSLRQLNPLLAVLARLVELAGARITAAEMLDLCATPPVARRFGFSADNLERLTQMVSASGVRWGLDMEHRQQYGLGAFGQNTWAAGLDRLLLGVTLDEDGQHFLGTALPLDNVESSDVDLVGRFAELVARVRLVTDELSARQSLETWVERLTGALQSLTSVSAADNWQIGHALREIRGLAEAADSHIDLLLSPGEIASLLEETFQGRASRANFRTGTLTMCTMLPMRSVPHRVVCLLGLDDGVFPRRARPDGENLLADDPWIGDTDRRSEDRQLLLDAIMAAQEQLIVVFAGIDARTGAGRPPAVLVGELLDTLDVTARTKTGGSVASQITRSHTLQPYAPANFEVRPPQQVAPFSFDRIACAGARAASSDREKAPDPFRITPLDPLDRSSIELADLVRFFSHPVRALVRERTGVWLGSNDEQIDEQIPVELGPLDSWAIGDAMLARHLEGLPLAQLNAAEWRRGQLPPREFGVRALGEIMDKVSQIAAEAIPYLEGHPLSQSAVVVTWPDVDHGRSRTLTGSVGSVFGDNLIQVGYSRRSDKHRLQAWIELLALTASHPERQWKAVLLGFRSQSVLIPPSQDFARLLLDDLIQLYLTGMSEPLPFEPKVSGAYARQRRRPGGEFRTEWLKQDWERARDETFAHYFGSSVESLMAEPARPAEQRGVDHEESRFGALARRVFDPMLKAVAR